MGIDDPLASLVDALHPIREAVDAAALRTDLAREADLAPGMEHAAQLESARNAPESDEWAG